MADHVTRAGLILLTTVCCVALPLLAATEKTSQFWLAGDVHLGTSPSALVLARLRAVVGDAPGFVNLEGPVSGSVASGKGLRLANAPAALPMLREVGVAVVGTANNHALDDGPKGPVRTVAAVRDAGMQPVGETTVATLVVGDTTLILTAHDLTGGVPPDLLEQLRAAARPGALLISTFHVTTNAGLLPPPELRRATAVALQAGATVVAGHGSHMVGPVEKHGDRVVAYGLGNLAFACDCTREQDAILLKLTVSHGLLMGTRVIPLLAGLHGKPVTQPLDAGILELLQALGSVGMTVQPGALTGTL